MMECLYKCTGRDRSGPEDNMSNSVGCGKQWISDYPRECSCGCLYVAWINYEEWVKNEEV